jgi:hypothetical protein
MDLPEPFEWIQRDALRVRCTDCGEVLTADVLDLHLRYDCVPDATDAGGQA